MATVLIVDGSKAGLEGASAVLGAAGHWVLPAPGPELGLVLLACDQPDLVLAHPGADMSGWGRLLGALRSATRRGTALLAWTDCPVRAEWMIRAGAVGVAPRLTGCLDLLTGHVERALLAAESSELRSAASLCALRA